MTTTVATLPRALKPGDIFEVDGNQWTVQETVQHGSQWWRITCVDDKPNMAPYFTFADDQTVDVIDQGVRLDPATWLPYK